MTTTYKRITEGKVLDTTPAGEVEMIANLYGIIDLQGDVIEMGTFRDSLKTSLPRIIDSHSTHSTLSAIATALDAREISRSDLPAMLRAKFPEATGGLYVKAQFMMHVPESEGVFQRIRAGAISEWSIGFDVQDSYPDRVLLSDGRAQSIRRITKGILYEVSSVLFGANQGTGVISAKTAQRQRLPSAIVRDLARVQRQYEAELRAGRGSGRTARRLSLEKRVLKLELHLSLADLGR